MTFIVDAGEADEMTRNKRSVLITLSILIPATLAAITVGGYLQQRVFFHETELIAGGGQDSAVQELSRQLGIELDPAIEQHAWLIENRGRLVIYQNFIEAQLANAMQVIQPKTERVDDLVNVYTGHWEQKGHAVNIVLVGSGPREYGGLMADGMDMILQVRAGTLFSPLRYVDASIEQEAFWSMLEEDSACLLYSSKGNCWSVGRADLTATLGKRHCPQSFIGSGVSCEPVDLVQLCGRVVAGMQERAGEHQKIQIDIRTGQWYDPTSEGWQVEIVDPDVRALLGR